MPTSLCPRSSWLRENCTTLLWEAMSNWRPSRNSGRLRGLLWDHVGNPCKNTVSTYKVIVVRFQLPATFVRFSAATKFLFCDVQMKVWLSSPKTAYIFASSVCTAVRESLMLPCTLLLTIRIVAPRPWGATSAAPTAPTAPETCGGVSTTAEHENASLWAAPWHIAACNVAVATVVMRVTQRSSKDASIAYSLVILLAMASCH